MSLRESALEEKPSLKAEATIASRLTKIARWRRCSWSWMLFSHVSPPFPLILLSCSSQSYLYPRGKKAHQTHPPARATGPSTHLHAMLIRSSFFVLVSSLRVYHARKASRASVLRLFARAWVCYSTVLASGVAVPRFACWLSWQYGCLLSSLFCRASKHSLLGDDSSLRRTRCDCM
ncbi:hypothetical protein IWX90DRAFT_104759 [Phyllosticta citrichinensis]|uniref:Uncharacterized protein n=1 Tax=Phyllosticta citrichinensis TaxID=1130410 RepID=A0ABR1Y2B8_9PEZI